MSIHSTRSSLDRNQSCTICINGIPSNLCNPDIICSQKYCGQFGSIQEICIRRDRHKNVNVFVRYYSAWSAAAAIRSLTSTKLFDTGCNIIVNRLDDNEASKIFGSESSDLTQLATIRAKNVQLKQECKAKDAQNSQLRDELRIMSQQYKWLQQQMNTVMKESRDLQQLVFAPNHQPPQPQQQVEHQNHLEHQQHEEQAEQLRMMMSMVFKNNNIHRNNGDSQHHNIDNNQPNHGDDDDDDDSSSNSSVSVRSLSGANISGGSRNHIHRIRIPIRRNDNDGILVDCHAYDDGHYENVVEDVAAVARPAESPYDHDQDYPSQLEGVPSCYQSTLH